MPSSSEPPNGDRVDNHDRLTSWKEIAGYLQRSVITAQRWEKTEGLPVYRHRHQKQDSVYAFRSEIDEWLRGARSLPVAEGQAVGPAETRQLSAPVTRPITRYPRRTFLVALSGVVAVLAITGWEYRSARIRAQREEALRQLELAAREGPVYGASTRALVHAYRLGLAAQSHVPNDSLLSASLRRVSRSLVISAEPQGVELALSSVVDTESVRFTVNGSAATRVPVGILKWHATHNGYVAREGLLEYNRDSLRVRLDPSDSTPEGMLRATGGRFELGLTHLGAQAPYELSDYWIDEFEVTNREFGKFVAAGGYENPKYWKEPFVAEGGREMSFHEAMERFRDRTGRPGAATWSAGDYQEGRGDYPVTGVSWYEAMAYAEFVGKTLPTIFHWARAAGVKVNSEIVPLSNVGSQGLTAVGRHRGISLVGAHDMAGNAKEWCFNATADGRFILGGAWNEPVYMFNEADGQSPFARAENYGFRLAKYIEPVPEALLRRVDYPRRDFATERPVTAEVFKFIRGLYSYDRSPLHASVDEVDDSNEHWRTERVSFDAAYGGERVTAYLLLPRHAVGTRLQTVLYFPGSDGIHLRSRWNGRPPLHGALIESGRAFVMPIFKGTYERSDSLTTDYPAPTDFYRQHTLMWFKDLERTVDYIETRPDLDASRLAYFGFSWGARLAPLFLALDPRFKTAVLQSGGLKFATSFPETDPFNFAPHVDAPVLMINGRYDYFFPLETSQKALFQLLGTAAARKQHVVLEAAHALPEIPVVTESIRWLDRYLGPVAPAQRVQPY